MNRALLKRRAAEALRHDLQPGERIVADSAVTSDPSRWAAAVLLTVAVALTAAGLVSLLSPPAAGPVFAIGLPVLGLGIQFLPRPMYVAVTDRRLICIRVSRLRSTPRRGAFAMPLADIRILNSRSSNHGASIQCEIPGGKPILLHVGRAGRKEFAEVETVLARSGAFAKLEPPYPQRRISQRRRTDTNDERASGRKRSSSKSLRAGPQLADLCSLTPSCRIGDETALRRARYSGHTGTGGRRHDRACLRQRARPGVPGTTTLWAMW